MRIEISSFSFVTFIVCNGFISSNVGNLIPLTRTILDPHYICHLKHVLLWYIMSYVLSKTYMKYTCRIRHFIIIITKVLPGFLR